jgi:hypothetical protein
MPEYGLFGREISRRNRLIRYVLRIFGRGGLRGCILLLKTATECSFFKNYVYKLHKQTDLPSVLSVPTQ